MAGETPHFFFLRQGKRITGPFLPEKLAEMERSGYLTADVEWSTDKVSWRPLETLLWKKTSEAKSSPAIAISESAVSTVNACRKSEPTTSSNVRPVILTPEPVGKGKVAGVENAVEVIDIPEPAIEKQTAGEFWGTTAALLWQPADVPAVLHTRWGQTGALRAGLTMAGVSVGLLLFILYRCLPQFCNVSVSFPKAIFVVCAPIIIFWIACILSRTLFGGKQSGSLGGDALIAGGAVWFAVITLAALLTVAKLFPWGGSVSNSILFAGIALPVFIYGCSGFILSMFRGLTTISGVSHTAAGQLVMIICAVPFFLAYVLFRTFLIP